MFNELIALGAKEYAAKENYKLVKELGTVQVNQTNRVVTSPNGGHSLRIQQADKAVYIPLRKDVPIDKKEYTIGEFEAAETFEFAGVEVQAGSKKAFAW